MAPATSSSWAHRTEVRSFGRRCCFLFFFLIVVTMGIWTSTVAVLDVGVPQMFPDGHNLNDVDAGRQWWGRWPWKKMRVG